MVVMSHGCGFAGGAMMVTAWMDVVVVLGLLVSSATTNDDHRLAGCTGVKQDDRKATKP